VNPAVKIVFVFMIYTNLLPCSQVVLNEHFRCAPEIIEFSNREFYDSRLVPLRLPGKSERLSPSIVDVFVRNGVKVGKVNEAEADEIVRLVKDFVADLSANTTPRSIGVISLVGDDQSRLIRGRLLDAVGPQLMARHDVLVGDPPTFQGAERDIIFISMVCSQGSVPTQNQQMHAQRANVAMSRARDRCILVRSIGLNDIPNNEDIKLPIIEFFQAAHTKTEVLDETVPAPSASGWMEGDHSVRALLERVLCGRGYAVRDMGVV
jgi:superfamily I DNA and/or RNA helicase